MMISFLGVRVMRVWSSIEFPSLFVVFWVFFYGMVFVGFGAFILEDEGIEIYLTFDGH